ncbi:hypothetical protein M0R88_07405 [Halorussus gelatinilyticus]|uniref:Uncharacterized protein n=1 Tax=Halorussus gelatinilyticus TaxID=2937524 RepID=A0A8U0IP33_9EURY|nr:hypothetical protein [Halorussus gelatinilyticus]UPW01914.1 hypothetical protein M0R88_07405 [Halorussus gelatinilyticus]
MRLTPVMLALLLALSPGAVAVQASAPTTPAPAQNEDDTIRPGPDANTTAVMVLGTTPERTAFDSQSIALGSSLAIDRNQLKSELSVAALDEQLQSAETIERKHQILVQYQYQIENRIISLKARERQSTQAFSNGTISEDQYLRTLGRIDAEAEQLRSVASALEARSRNVRGLSMSSFVSTVQGKLTTLEGPVRDRIARSLRGKAPKERVFVATADTGVVLSTITEGTYVREIVRHDYRNPSASGSLTLLQAQKIVYDKYTWANNNPSRGTSTSPYGTTNVFSVTVKHPHGSFVAYLDGGTEKVFKEIQHKRLTGNTPLPTGPSVSNTSENLTVTVNRTYAGGPLRVNLTNATGAPVSGEVRIDGELVGRTNADGVLWTLSPADRFEVSASYDFRTVNVTATPVQS